MASGANSNNINKDEELELTKNSWVVNVKTYGRIIGKYAFKYTKKIGKYALIKTPKMAFKFTKRLVLKRKCCKVHKKRVKFSNFMIKINTDKHKWQKCAIKIVANLEGTGPRDYELDGETGYLRISSLVDHDTLMRALAKVGHDKAELIKLDLGDCSSKLYGPGLPQKKPKEAPPPQLNSNPPAGNQTVPLSLGPNPNQTVPLSLGPNANNQVRANNVNNHSGANNSEPFYGGYGHAMPHYPQSGIYNAGPFYDGYGHGMSHYPGSGTYNVGSFYDGYGHTTPYGVPFNAGYGRSHGHEAMAYDDMIHHNHHDQYPGRSRRIINY